MFHRWWGFTLLLLSVVAFDSDSSPDEAETPNYGKFILISVFSNN
jgi:hypothetical protein